VAAGGRTRDNVVPSEARRAQARALAAEMFFERGYESTTMREIARALDIKVASLYYHFPDKEQILFELIDSVMGQLSAGLQDVIRGEKDPAVQLAAVVVNHVVLHALRPRASTLGDSELRSLTGERHAAGLQQRDDYERLVLGVLRRGQRQGRFSPADPKLTAYAIMAQSSHVGTWYREAGRLSLRQVAETYVTLAFRMVSAEPLPRATVARLVDELRAYHEALR
jgi:TetR/AcrR family transcriptional regulator, cholesterol catabolism regulator